MPSCSSYGSSSTASPPLAMAMDKSRVLLSVHMSLRQQPKPSQQKKYINTSRYIKFIATNITENMVLTTGARSCSLWSMKWMILHSSRAAPRWFSRWSSRRVLWHWGQMDHQMPEKSQICYENWILHGLTFNEYEQFTMTQPQVSAKDGTWAVYVTVSAEPWVWSLSISLWRRRRDRNE